MPLALGGGFENVNFSLLALSQRHGEEELAFTQCS